VIVMLRAVESDPALTGRPSISTTANW